MSADEILNLRYDENYYLTFFDQETYLVCFVERLTSDHIMGGVQIPFNHRLYRKSHLEYDFPRFPIQGDINYSGLREFRGNTEYFIGFSPQKHILQFTITECKNLARQLTEYNKMKREEEDLLVRCAQ